MKVKIFLLALSPAVLVSLLCIAGVFGGLENRVYDLFLRFRPNREPAREVAFLDVDDNAIAYNGVFPWPRSVIADGLLRLKEYGARAAVFDIEFIDKGPQGVDAVYLIQASRLFGKNWVTLNLLSSPLPGEQVERRTMAEKRFSHPVIESPNAFKGKYVDILPPLPGFALSAAGAGFTNVEADKDGKRRRVDLAQNIRGYWYLQLALSSLVDYLGNPSIELDKRWMYLKNAKMPDGATKNIKIPLDGNGRMLLDRPKTDFPHSYSHISFSDFSLMEELELELEQYARSLGDTKTGFFSELDPYFARMPLVIMDLIRLFDVIHPARAGALENFSDELFKTYTECRRISRGLMREILNMDIEVKVKDIIPALAELYPDNAGAIIKEAEYISALAQYLRIDLDRYEGLSEKIERAVSDKFCILERAGTGTNGIGTNPFYSEYVNVGTHGVVLDMILSGSFIAPAGVFWQAFITLAFVVLFFLFSSKFSPAPMALLGVITVIILTGLTALLFRFTGIFFSPLTAVFSIVPAVILREII
jgi:adenylate cyclase